MTPIRLSCGQSLQLSKWACLRVVRADGMTDCAVQGLRLRDSRARARPGMFAHPLSRDLRGYRELLDTASSSSACPEGACQASASLPANVGVCVSSATLN